MSAHLRPSTIETLKRLWIALPVRAPEGMGDMDVRERQMAILESYCRALSEFSPAAIGRAVDDLEAGRVEDASRDFCPKPPRLAEIVRGVQRAMDAESAEQRRKAQPRIPPPMTLTEEKRSELSYKFELLRKALHGSTEARDTLYALVPGARYRGELLAHQQRDKAIREGREFIEAGVTIVTAKSRAAQHRYPTGSTWLWAAQEVWGPSSTFVDANQQEQGRMEI